MPWPFVSRARLADAMRDRDYWQARATEAEARERAATQRVVDIALERTAPTPAPVFQPRPKREPDAVDTAIDFVAQGDIPKRRYLERWAKGERRKGREAGDIATEILHPRVSDDADEAAPV